MPQLLIVPTPIGNLRDITLRALDALKEVDYILCEDTRQTAKLTKTYDILTPLKAYHKDNEHAILETTLTLIKTSKAIALVSDAGTPAISDPGFLLVRACLQEGISVNCLPGPTAFVPALVCSGLPINEFIFKGFLPHKKGRQKALQTLTTETNTIVLYESPHRLLKTLNDLKATLGNGVQLSVSRELTKMYEETIQGNIDDVMTHFTQTKPKGEFVIILKNA